MVAREPPWDRQRGGVGTGLPAENVSKATPERFGSSMPKRREFQHESIQDGKSLITYLEALSHGFSSGALVMNDQEGEIVLKPQGLIRFEIDAAHKRGRTRLIVRFDWKEEDGTNPNAGGPLVIRGDES